MDCVETIICMLEELEDMMLTYGFDLVGGFPTVGEFIDASSRYFDKYDEARDRVRKTLRPSKDVSEIGVLDNYDWDLIKYGKLTFQIVKEDQTPVTYQYPEVSSAEIIEKEFSMTEKKIRTNTETGSKFIISFKCIVQLYIDLETFRKKKRDIDFVKKKKKPKGYEAARQTGAISLGFLGYDGISSEDEDEV